MVAVAVVFVPPVGTVVVVWSVVVDLVVVVRVEREVPDRVLVVPVSVPRVPVNIPVPVVT